MSHNLNDHRLTGHHLNVRHLNDQELLLAADDSISSRSVAKFRKHLHGCETCGTRLAELESALLELREAHREILEPQLRDIAVPRSVLRARMAEASARNPRPAAWFRFLYLPSAIQTIAVTCVLCVLAVTSARVLWHREASFGAKPVPAITAANLLTVPNRKLTPGAARAVSLGEVCSMAHEEVEKDVPGSVRDQVFHEYGIADPRASDYEIDYLIAPGLGGTADIHNLWPESYNSPIWNAHVKDALEEHLHQLVCSGKVDLRTAQQDISTDWIAAYKKYFHANRPVGERVAAVRHSALVWAKLGLS